MSNQASNQNDCVECREPRREQHDPTAQPGHFPTSPKLRRQSLDAGRPKQDHQPKVTAETQTPDFVAPDLTQECPSITIEFCNRCRWLHRATWVQTELFLTFGEVLQSVTLIPRSNPDTAGRWRVWVSTSSDASVKPACVWDRKTEGGFGELKELKQRLRDYLEPHKSLGHSDKGGHKEAGATGS